jgi:hypothetical protein
MDSQASANNPIVFDKHKNLSISTLAVVPDDVVNGTIFEVAPGDGFMFEANMPATICPADQPPSYDNAEVVYVTAVSGDSITLRRGDQGSFRRAVAAGWLIVGSITTKAVTDLEDAVHAIISSAPGGANDLAAFQAALADGDRNFTSDFGVTADLTVQHGLGKYPSVTVINSAGDEVEGEVKHVDTNSLRVTFSAPFAGTVICN